MNKIINKTKIIYFAILALILNTNPVSAVMLPTYQPSPGEIFVEKILTILFIVILIGLILYLISVLNFIYSKSKNKSKNSIKIEKRISFFLKIIIVIIILYFLVSSSRYDLAQIYERICWFNCE